MISETIDLIFIALKGNAAWYSIFIIKMNAMTMMLMLVSSRRKELAGRSTRRRTEVPRSNLREPLEEPRTSSSEFYEKVTHNNHIVNEVISRADCVEIKAMHDDCFLLETLACLRSFYLK